MSFISYAQNFEDVMLWRALKHVDRGFYIDVGAWSALQDSVTRAFYERGWNGINVEPNPPYYDELVQHRPRDVNLRQAISDVPGRATMYFVSNPGLSSMDETIARGYEASGWVSTPGDVDVTTLSALWAAHVPTGQDVHFLKIDVEGLEEAVIRGNDWTRNRPWVVVVEATKPMSQEESFESWDPILTENGYALAYVDGLNRFYIAVERRYLADSLRYPPNVFDDMIRLREQAAEAQTAAVESARAQLETRLQAAEAQTAAVESARAQLETRLQAAEAQTAAVESARAQLETRLQAAEAQTAAVESARAQLETRLQAAEAQMAAVERLLRYTTDSRSETIRRNSELTIHNNQLISHNNYLIDRTAWERLVFRTNGRPIKLLRRVLFHNNGRPRGVFRKYILDSAGKPRRAFHYWMTSPSYLAHSGTVQTPTQPEGTTIGLQPVWRNLIDVDSRGESDLDELMERIRVEVAAAKHGLRT